MAIFSSNSKANSAKFFSNGHFFDKNRQKLVPPYGPVMPVRFLRKFRIQKLFSTQYFKNFKNRVKNIKKETIFPRSPDSNSPAGSGMRRRENVFSNKRNCRTLTRRESHLFWKKWNFFTLFLRFLKYRVQWSRLHRVPETELWGRRIQHEVFLPWKFLSEKNQGFLRSGIWKIQKFKKGADFARFFDSIWRKNWNFCGRKVDLFHEAGCESAVRRRVPVRQPLQTEELQP